MPETTEALVREGDPELERPVRPASLSFSKSLPLPLPGIVASTFALTAAVTAGAGAAVHCSGVPASGQCGG